MAQSTTMYPFNHTVAQMNNNEPSSLLERRQQTAPFLQQLELPALPPLSQLMTSSDKKKAALNITSSLPVTTPNTRAHVEAIVAMEAAATASMITSTAQPLIQQENTFSTSAGAATVPSQSLLTTSTTNPTNLLYTTAPQNTTTYKTSPVNNLLPPYNQTEETLEQTLAGMTGSGFMDQQHQMFNAAAAVVAGMTDYTIPTSYIDSRQREGSVSSTSSDKVYSFVAIPGTNQLKRPRRRYDEIERLYHCNWAGCTKSYGTLNHLNAHVSMQQHVSFLLFVLCSRKCFVD